MLTDEVFTSRNKYVALGCKRKLNELCRVMLKSEAEVNCMESEIGGSIKFLKHATSVTTSRFTTDRQSINSHLSINYATE